MINKNHQIENDTIILYPWADGTLRNYPPPQPKPIDYIIAIAIYIVIKILVRP